MKNIKEFKKYILTIVAVFSLLLMSCGGTSSYSGSGTRSVNHYHHGGYGGWGNPYYGDDVIIIDDGIDIGMPDAIDYPMDYGWD